MRLLRVARPGPEHPRLAGEIPLPELAPDDPARRAQRRLRERGAVGAHVGDQARAFAARIDALVEHLRDLHRPLDPEAEPARRLLLERRGGERCGGTAPLRGALDRGDREFGLPDPPRGVRRRPARREAEPIQRRAVEPARPGPERAASGRRLRLDGPVFDRREGFDRGLALAHQPQRHRLHAPGRAATRNLAPQHRRQPEPHQVVQRPACLLRPHQVQVDFARMRHRVPHGSGGDLVEDDARDRRLPDRVPLPQPGQHLPGDRLALAVGVGRQDQAAGIRECRPDGRERPRRPAPGLVDHRETVLGIDRARPGRQVADMAAGRQHPVPAAEKLADCPRLGGRFDDDHVHRATPPPGPSRRPRAAERRHGRRLSPRPFPIVSRSSSCLPVLDAATAAPRTESINDRKPKMPMPIGSNSMPRGHTGSAGALGRRRIRTHGNDRPPLRRSLMARSWAPYALYDQGKFKRAPDPACAAMRCGRNSFRRTSRNSSNANSGEPPASSRGSRGGPLPSAAGPIPGSGDDDGEDSGVELR